MDIINTGGVLCTGTIPAYTMYIINTIKVLVVVVTYRIRAKNMTIVRFSKTVARYSMIRHKSDAGNPYNVKRLADTFVHTHL